VEAGIGDWMLFRRMLAALERAPLAGDVAQVSLGLACGHPTSDARKVYEAADAAMYEAKRLGGAQCRFASPTTDVAQTT